MIWVLTPAGPHPASSSVQTATLAPEVSGPASCGLGRVYYFGDHELLPL
jgi:hypothetical protein